MPADATWPGPCFGPNTITCVPVFTRLYRSIASSLVIRMQPDEIACPIYSGWFLIVFATGTMTMTRFVCAAISGIYLMVAIPLEERSLLASSNGAYADYRREVRWKLVPWVY